MEVMSILVFICLIISCVQFRMFVSCHDGKHLLALLTEPSKTNAVLCSHAETFLTNFKCMFKVPFEGKYCLNQLW